MLARCASAPWNRNHRVESGEHIRHGDADLHGFATRRGVGLTGDAHQAGHPLDEEVVARALPVGARLAESGDRAVDESGVVGAERRVIQSVFFEPADLEVFDDDIALSSERSHDLLALGLGEVDRHRALSAIGAKEVGGIARGPIRVVAGSFREGGPPAAGVVAGSGPLHLDHAGAEVGEGLPRPGAREDAAELEHADFAQRRGHRARVAMRGGSACRAQNKAGAPRQQYESIWARLRMAEAALTIADSSGRRFERSKSIESKARRPQSEGSKTADAKELTEASA